MTNARDMADKRENVGETKFVTPCALPSEHEREILTILIEEAAEVQQRATKMLRFGVAEVQPGQPLSNSERLSDEIGDFNAVLHMAWEQGLVSQTRIDAAAERKRDKLRIYMQTTAKSP